MKKLSFLLLSLLLIVGITSCKEKNEVKTVKIHGKFNTRYKPKYMYCERSGSAYTKKNNVALSIDPDGYFSVEFDLDKPTYFRLSPNTVYLTPGDDLEITLEKDPKKSTFTGIGAEVNNYLADNYNGISGSYFQDRSKFTTNLDSIKLYTDKLSSERLTELKKVKNATDEFVDLETARINADIINTYLYSVYLRDDVKAAKTREEFHSLWQEYLTPIVPIFTKLFERINKRDYLDVSLVKILVGTIERDSLLKSSIKLHKHYEQYNEASKKLFNLTKATPESIAEIKDFSKTLQCPDLRAAVQDKITETTRLMKGNPAIDFKLEDITGKTVKLSDYKGKYLYLDFWATWCGPCKREAPFFEKLNKEINRDDILFISISVDSHIKAWRNYLAKHDKKTLQLHSDDLAISRDWQVNGIPRFVLIDKDFNIINAFAKRPSTKEAKEILSQLK